MRRASVLATLLVSATLLGSGCLSLVIPEHAPAPATTDDATVEAMLANRDFMGSGFVEINHAPFPSDLETGRVVTMYVSADAAAAYQAVSPDTTSAGAAFPVGGMIVRTSSDPNGTLEELTFMVKHEPGYFPAVGDFLFGVSAPDGTPAVDASGHTEWGALADCAQCHETRASSGFLFGVAVANR
ncbi:MAG TPA: hypothetical protein VGL86_05665 [Polyangia bacterium]